jgi:hypothetical protein
MDLFESFCPSCRSWFGDWHIRHYGMDGERLSMREWADKFENTDRHIADEIRVIADEPIRISTVLIGIDHRFFPDQGPPLIFETMVFGGPWDGCAWRYPTKEGALAGHDQVIATVMDTTRSPHSDH